MAIANALAGDDSLDSAERRPPAGLAVFICGLVLGAALGISLAPQGRTQAADSYAPGPSEALRGQLR